MTIPTPPGAEQRAIRLVAAPDKFRGTLSGRDAADAICLGARDALWSADPLPLADGGEGTLDACGGEARTTVVTGPNRTPVAAEWRLIDDGTAAPVAVIEMARASGLILAGGRRSNNVLTATTRGTGELIAAALGAGARKIIVGCGGSATTDGGAGALEVLTPEDLEGVELLVACDVDTVFVDAAKVFGPQKGADAEAITELEQRLERLVGEYRDRYGVDVEHLARSGAAGGLAGGLAALGGRLVSGFDLIADLVGFDAAMKGASLVVTGEGRFDETSLAGKVVGGVIARARGTCKVLVVAGSVAPALPVEKEGVEVVSLVDRYGRAAAFGRTAELVREVVADTARRMSIALHT